MLDNFSTGKHPIIARHRNQVELIENGSHRFFCGIIADIIGAISAGCGRSGMGFCGGCTDRAGGTSGLSGPALCRLTSLAYPLLRRWHELPVLPYLGQQLAYIRDDPNLAFV